MAWVYLLRQTGGNLYKIGATGRIHAHGRIREVNKGSTRGVPVHVIQTPDAFGLEAELHRRYREYHTRGEWFSLPQQAVWEIMAMDRDPRLSQTPRPVRYVGRDLRYGKNTYGRKKREPAPAIS